MTRENSMRPASGYLMLLVTLALYVGAGYGIYMIVQNKDNPGPFIFLDLGLWLVAGLMCSGFTVVEPNGSKVVLLFGRYVGTIRSSGFWWVNPFSTRRPVSLRIRTLNGERLKVNDLTGNPVEIAAIIVWQVVDTYQASFDVDDYEQYVNLQSETSLRHSASAYPYDGDDDTPSLRHNTSDIQDHLLVELNDRLGRAGVKVLEARLSHLAYAPEIAGVMLRRQQAAAIISARQKIVDGAVGMVEMALERLESQNVLQLDEERKAAMVTNLMVVLCSENAAQPVLNTGTLYP
ncbi:MAG TPA: SPFH domain-containing protein [Fimbriimonadaceae bacterium]|nr:SPFH domain-containing protein [Fimbriimonadaceae bacterium]HRJ96267.1 SPFH domain-containing protein [Fimbriimonadaceae bacterium]